VISKDPFAGMDMSAKKRIVINTTFDGCQEGHLRVKI
jgi:hypothetical protein